MAEAFDDKIVQSILSWFCSNKEIAFSFFDNCVQIILSWCCSNKGMAIILLDKTYQSILSIFFYNLIPLLVPSNGKDILLKYEESIRLQLILHIISNSKTAYVKLKLKLKLNTPLKLSNVSFCATCVIKITRIDLSHLFIEHQEICLLGVIKCIYSTFGILFKKILYITIEKL